MDFHVHRESSLAPVWVSLPMLPIHFHDKHSLFSILAPVGRPLFVDTTTAAGTRPNVARACVEIDLLKPPCSRVWVAVEGEPGKKLPKKSCRNTALLVGAWATLLRSAGGIRRSGELLELEATADRIRVVDTSGDGGMERRSLTQGAVQVDIPTQQEKASHGVAQDAGKVDSQTRQEEALQGVAQGAGQVDTQARQEEASHGVLGCDEKHLMAEEHGCMRPVEQALFHAVQHSVQEEVFMLAQGGQDVVENSAAVASVGRASDPVAGGVEGLAEVSTIWWAAASEDGKAAEGEENLQLPCVAGNLSPKGEGLARTQRASSLLQLNIDQSAVIENAAKIARTRGIRARFP
nr:uncharacterized protein LOC113696766 [Coffea arabica]